MINIVIKHYLLKYNFSLSAKSISLNNFSRVTIISIYFNRNTCKSAIKGRAVVVNLVENYVNI